MDLVVTQTWLQIPAKPLISHVPTELLLTFPKVQFPQIQIEDTSVYFTSLFWGLKQEA